MDIIKEKIKQANELLEELNTDAWIVFVRETSMMADPTMAMVVGFEAVWNSFFIFTRGGDAVAVVGNLDAENFRQSGRFTEVVPYTKGVKEDLRQIIAKLDPASIAVNYSLDNPAADGLTHGMYLQLLDYLEGTPYIDRIISAEQLVSKLRSRKLPSEVDLISDAAKVTVEVWNESLPDFKAGMTEIEIAAVIEGNMRKRGLASSFDTIVNAGDKTRPGHGLPTKAKVGLGDLLHVDFGVKLNDYCSDLQRLVYFNRFGETKPPEELLEAFQMVESIITETGKMCKPGVKGFEIDGLAREMLADNGYPEYEHALGHQVGRDVHDGGGIIGPKWERYGKTPEIELEAGNVSTLELEINLPGIGCVGLEEDICVTENGARFLCARQTELTVK
jgi:Xaa-Pro aminopeptidase